MAEVSCVSCHRLYSTLNYNSVFRECEGIAASWTDFAVQLNIDRNAVRRIELENNAIGTRECLKKLLDEWFSQTPSRSWKIVCEALKILNVSLSEKVSLKHQCSCSLCTGKEGSKAVQIVSKVYDDISNQLDICDLIKVAEYMKVEDALEDSDVQKIKKSVDEQDNEYETFFTLLESAISRKEYNLKIFATALKNQNSTQEFGKRLLSEYCTEDLPKHPIATKDVERECIQLELPSVAKHISQSLENCPGGAQILKELIQNADDAEASEVKFILDSNQYPTDHLIHKNLADFQGPALYAWNNAMFSEKDWYHFGKIEESSKEKDVLKIGRFGIGFLSVFHITDLPVAISNERAAILDPNSFIGTDKKGYDCSVKEFLKYRSHAACFESLGPCSVSPHAKNYPATLFRFPLRSNRTISKSKISSDIYSVEDVKKSLFQSFMQEAPSILLFLKHVEEISLYDEDRLLFKVSVDPSHKETVKKERNALIQLGQSYSLHMYPSLRIYAMTILSVDNDSDKNYYHWLIFNMIGSTIDTICKLSQKLQFLPWVGIATLLPSKLNLSNIDIPKVDLTHLSNVLQMIQSQLTTNKIRLSMYEVEGIQRHTEGHAFCFLPLPNITHLPINIHGYFGVSDNRRTIEWPASNNTSDIAVWNQDLVLKHLAPLYSLLIGCRTKLISYKNTPLPSEHDQNVTDAYAAWPLYSELKNEIIWSQLIMPTITSCLDFPVFWSATGKWVTMKEAVFLHEHGPRIPTTAVDILIKAKVPVVKIPQNIWQTLNKCKDAKLNVVTQTHVRDAYKEKFAFDSFEKFQPFFEYLLEDIHVGSKKFEELLNLKIIPVSVASRKFKLRTLKLYKSGEEIYYLTDTVSGVSKLLPGLESEFVDSVTINSDLINQKLLELAKSKKFRLQLGNSEIFCQKLLPSSIRKWSNFKHNEPITWMINTPGYPPLNWILDVWKWFSKNPDMIMKIVGIPILPKERIEENSTCCTLLPIPSKGNKYYWRSDDDMELTCVFEKLEATVISTNDFVFSHGKLSRFIFNINISNILEYLVKRPEKVYLLEETEKKRLLMHIAQTFSRMKEKKNFFHLLHELSIFQIGVGCTPVKFSSLKSFECILPPFNMQFDETLEYPHSILNITHTDVFSLLTEEINYSVMPKVKVYGKILQFAQSQLQGSSSTNNGDKLITWVMKVESSKLSPELINYLSSCRFVRTQASPLELKKPNELYDPKDDNFRILFHSDKDKVFPAEYYIKKDTLDVFVNLGLKTWEKLTSDVKMFGNFLKERAENVKKAASKKSGVSEIQVGCRILEIIGNFPKHGVDHLMSAVESVKFLKVHVSRPLDFPECLPWKGEEYGHKLVAPNKVCFEQINSNLIGCVLPIIHDDYEKELSIQLPKKVIKKFLVPTVENVIEQLNVLIKLENIENPSKLSTIIHKIYQYLNDTPEKVSKLLPKKWVWWNYQGQFRFMPSKIFVLNFQIDLHPFMYLIKSDYSFLKDYDKLLRESGIKESPTTTDLINVLKEMSSGSCHLSEDHIQMSISILDYLFQRGEGKGDVFIPTNDFKLLPVDKCTYDDREWIRKKIGLQNKDLSLDFVHGSISPRVAEFFGVQPLSKKVAPSKELQITFKKIEQKESLTHRLRGIVNDYNDKIDIFKELIQNADDAGATKVKFLMDWRKHGKSSLFNDEMKFWQGPAIVAYNNSTFSDQDFDNILNIAGESKTSDPLKIGRYGLGFCACYSLTDVPSLISRRFFMMFDPHTHYIGNRVSEQNAGLQIDLFKEKEGVSIYEDQFSPYKDLFGCNIDQFDKNGFDGTIFRFPLRMRECQNSEISNEQYNPSRINKQIEQLKKETRKLLIFLKRVQSLEFFELKEGKSIQEMELLFKVVKAGGTVRAKMIQSHGSGPSAALKPECAHEVIRIEHCVGKNKQEHHYLLSSAIVNDCKIEKGRLPIAELAVELTDNYTPIHTEGQLFCFLPLPIKHSLPFYVNGYFDVTKDRKALRLPQDGAENEWNKTIINEVLPVAFVQLLEVLTGKVKLSALDHSSRAKFLKKFYSLWPNQAVTEFLPVDSMIYALQSTKKSLFWSDAKGGVWVKLDQVYWFDQPEPIPSELQESANEILISNGFYIVNCPNHVLKIIADSKRSKSINYISFFKEVFLTQIEIVDCKKRNHHLQFALKMTGEKQKNPVLVDILKKTKCIPIADSSALAYPKDLIDVSCATIANLFVSSDKCFPHEDFREECYTKALISLGMITKEISVERLAERAKSICTLSHERACERIRYFIKYVCDMEDLEFYNNQTTEKRLERIKVLSSIKFLMAKAKPDNLSIPWYNADGKLFSPSQLNSLKDIHLVFTQKPVFHSPFSEDHPHFSHVEKYLGIDDQHADKIGTVMENIKCLIDDISGKKNIDDHTRDYLNKVFISIYYFLNQCCNISDASSKITSSLSQRQCVWQNGKLHYPHQMLFRWNETPYYPYICLLSEDNKKFEKLFELLCVKKEADFTFLSNVMLNVKKSFNNKPLSDDALKFILNITNQIIMLRDDRKTKSASTFFLPDSDGILCPTTNLCCDSSLRGFQSNKEDKLFVHKSIPRQTAINLGAYSNQDAVLQNIENRDFLKQTGYGQCKNLVGEINNFLKKNPSVESIFKEFVRMAEYARASEIAFVLDHRINHPNEHLISETEEWKRLQSIPALCIFYNKRFEEEDIKNLCRIGMGEKNEADNMSSVEFNVAYHLTDCPSFVSFDETGSPTDFCVFDPLQAYYCPLTVGSNAPVRRWTGKNNPFSQFCDQFQPYLIDKFEEMRVLQSSFSDLNHGFTVFRLPITHFKPIKGNRDECFQEAKIKNARHMHDSIRTFNQVADKILLFLKNVKSLSVFEIEEDSNIIHHVSTTCISVKDTALAINGDTYETRLCSFFPCNDKNKTSEWLINESKVSKHLKPMLSTATKRGLQPHGATALQLRYDNKSNQGLLFHSVPLCVNSSMPVHMNAHFIVNDSHNQLATPTGFEKWNKFIFRDLLVPSYVELILQARKYIDGTINSAEWYYGLFPNVIVASKDNPESVSTCKCFYETLVRNNLPVLLDGRSNDDIRWLQITEGDIGYFYLPTAANDSLCQILLSIGMPITHAPKFVYDNLCVGHKKSISLVTSKNVCHYLRTLTDENAVLKNVETCIQLLQFCSQDAQGKDLKSFLKGIPLLLTSNNTLDSSGSLYESTFASLLPNLKEKFIHPQLGESKVVTDVLKQVVVPLPSDVVAQNILLPDTDEAMRLNSEQAKLVSQLLEFLEVSVLHQSDRVEYARQVTKSFFKKPIILSSSGLFYPLCLSKHVFDGTNDANLIKKLGCAILDTKVLKLAKIVVPLFISSTSNSDDIITCLKSDPPKTVQHQFTPDEVNRFLILLLSASNIPSNISYLLKNLPIFKTVDGSYHCLNEAKEVYFITGSLSVCAGFSKLQDITQTLIIYASQMEIYKRLVPQAQPLTSVQLYTNLVIPNLECFTSSKDLKKHLSVVINWISSNPDEFSPDDIDNIKMVLKKTRLIDINGKKYLASELFDPDVLFHATFNKGKLPPVNIWNGDKLAFLRSLGLQSKVDHDVWLHSAKHVAEEGSAVELRLLPVELIKKSEILLKSLQKIIEEESKCIDESNNLSTYLKAFLQSAATIQFIHSNDINHLEKVLDVITDKSSKRKRLLMCFSESVIMNKTIHLLCQTVLPQSCEFVLKLLPCVRDALLVKILSKRLIVVNLTTLSDQLCAISNQQFVVSDAKRKAIQTIKKVFEDYYQILNDVNDETESLQDLHVSTQRCILLCPNDFCFKLVQPSQLVMHISNDTELQPFCYQVPSNLRKFDDLWCALEIKKEIDCALCFKIFSDVKVEMEKVEMEKGDKRLSRSDPYWNVCMCTYSILISLLRSSANTDVPANLAQMLLPSDDYHLGNIADLVLNDLPRIKDKLQKLKTFKYKFIYPPPPDQKGEVTLPKSLSVKLLSNVISEELHHDVFDRLNRCKEHELFKKKKRKHSCSNTEAIKDTFSSQEFKEGLTRLYWHQHEKDPSSDPNFQQKLKEIKSLSLYCVTNIKTIVKFQNMTIEGTENTNCLCYLERSHRRLILSHIAHVYVQAFQVQLADIVSTFFNKCITMCTPLVAIMSCPPKSINSVLTELNVRRFNPGQTISDFDVGMVIPLDEVIQQSKEDMLIFINFSEEEKVLYHRIVNGKPSCVVARIHKCPVQNRINLHDKYVQIYTEKNTKGPIVIKVSILQLYKILNASQCKMLLHKRSTMFDEPLLLAQLPEDQEKLFDWIKETLDYNNSHSCCTCIQLSKRILSHMYYSFVTSKKQPDLFLAAAKCVLQIVTTFKNKKTENAVIKFVRGLDYFEDSIFGKQPQVTTTPANMQLQPTPPPALHLPPYFDPHHAQYFMLPPEMQYYMLPHNGERQRMAIENRSETSTSRAPPMYKLVPIVASSGKSHPDRLAAKAWINQAKVDFIAAIDILMNFQDAQEFQEMKKATGEQEISGGILLSKEMFLKESSGDFTDINKLMKGCKYPALVCFLCHDMLEKFIKGIMYLKVGVPSHLLNWKNLFTLVEELSLVNEDIFPKQLLDAIEMCVSSISIHGNKSRYPSYHYPPLSPAASYNQTEAIECLKNVQKMMVKVLKDEDIHELVGDLENIQLESFKTADIKSMSAIPKFWTPFEDDDGGFNLVLLDDYVDDVEEYHFVSGTMEATLTDHYTIERVERIQNKLLWQRYIDCAKRMMEFNDGVTNEMSLFHGTSEVDPETIYKGDSGFDMRFSDKGLWGKGNYFAVNASYSNKNYAHECADNRKQMLLANVLTGYDFNSPKDPDITKPPIRIDKGGGISRRFDSVSGTAGGSKIFITYENDRAYPAYLITYRESK